MKKVKTLLLSLVIMLASAFISACSCGSTEVTQILETGISLRCVTEEGLITNEVDEYGVIHIEMYRGQKFEIEYTLTPDNVTTTEVGWVFSKSGIVNSGSTNSYSKSKQEKVTFTASGVGETQIEFITAATKKKAVVNVSVYQTIGNLPVFETPSNFVYNASKRELSWKAVTHYTNGEVASKDNSGDIEGLSFYEVKIQEYNDELAPVGEAKVIRTSSNYIPGDEIQTGKRYNVTVTAVGNNQKARSSSESTAFKFIQISENANLANDNGTITFKMPRYSPEAYIYFKGAEDEAAKHRVSATAGSNMSFNYKEIVGETNAKTMTKYNFCVKFYPFGYAENNEGWQGYLENDGNGYRVYESIFSEEIVVHKLATPQVNVKNSTANMSVGKVSDADNSSYSFASNYAQSLISIALPAGAYFDFNVKSLYSLNGLSPIDPNNKNVQTDTINISQPNFADISTSGWGAGEKILRVVLKGDPATTIASEERVVYFYKLPTVSSLVTDGDVINFESANGASGVELYFVNTTDTTKNTSRYIAAVNNVITFDISNLETGIKDPGVYRVYAKLVGTAKDNIEANTDSGNRFIITGGVLDTVEDCLSNDLEIYAAPTDLKIQKDGVVTFKKAEDKEIGEVTNYVAKIAFQTNENDEPREENVELVPQGEEANYLRLNYVNLNDGYASFDLYDALIVIYSRSNQITLPEGTVVDRAYIDMLFGEGCVISVEILSKGAGKPTNKDNYSISSSLSATRTAGRLAGVSTLQLIRPEDADKKSYFNARLITENIEDYSDKTFIIKIGEHTFSTKRDEDRASSNQNLYQFKLMTIKETGNEGKTLWEVINNTIKENYNQGMFEVEIYIEGQDSDDILGAATLDSAVARISYTFTGSVKGIQMISNGMIGWNAVSYDLNESKWVDGDARIGDIFEIIFYDKDGKYLESIEYVHKSNAGVESTDAGADAGDDTGDDTETELETLTTDYIYDISAILDKYKGNVVTIAIVQTYSVEIGGDENFYYALYNEGEAGAENPDKYTNIESDDFYNHYYATRLQTVSLRTVVDASSNNVIEWDAVENATEYYVTSDKDIFKTQDQSGSEVFQNFKIISSASKLEIIIPQDLSVDSYSFEVYALSTANKLGTQSNPYILNSLLVEDTKNGLNPSKTIQVINGDIRVFAYNNWIAWEEIDGADYNVKYAIGDNPADDKYTDVKPADIKAYEIIKGSIFFVKDAEVGKMEDGSEGSEGSEGTDDGSVEEEVVQKLKIKYFDATAIDPGKISLQIEPIISFATYGIVVNRTTSHIAVVYKMNSVTNVTTTKGEISFNFVDNSKASNPKFNLFTKTGNGDTAKYNPVAASNYAVKKGTLGATDYTIDVYGLSAGDYTFAIQVVADGLVDSKIVEATSVFTKVTTVSLSKTGDYLYWSPLEIIVGTGESAVVVSATYYEIKVISSTGEESIIYLKTIRSESTETKGEETDTVVNYTCMIGTVDATTQKIVYAENTKFSYANGKFKLLFELAVDAPSGDYKYSIMPKMDTVNYLNGDMSSASIITKLNCGAEEGAFPATYTYGQLNFNMYEQNGSNLPTAVEITIQGYELKLNDETKEYDKVKIDSAIIEYSIAKHNEIAFDTFNIAGGYIIDLNADEYSQMHEAGAYIVTLKFIGNNNNIIDSKSRTSDYFNKLEATSLEMKKGALTLSKEVTSAESYNIKIYDGTTFVGAFDFTPAESVSLPDQIVELGADATESNGISNMYLTEKEYKTHIKDEKITTRQIDFEIDKIYTIYVQAQATSFLSSKWSTGFNFAKLKTPEDVNIDKVESLDDKNNSVLLPALYWKNPNIIAANGYEIKYDEATKSSSYEGELECWTLDTTLPLNADGYQIQLRVLGNTTAGTSSIGWLSSNFSEVTSDATVAYIANNTAPKVSNGNITWTAITGAEMYKVSGVHRETGAKFEKYVNGIGLTDGSNPSLNIVDNLIENFLAGGYWDISVETFADPSISVISQNEEVEHNFTTKVFKPVSPNDTYKILDGMLSWEYSITDLQTYLTEENKDKEEKVLLADAIAFVVDMVKNGESSLAPTIDLSFLYNIKLVINGVNTQHNPTSIKVLDASGAELKADEYANAETLRYSYEVSIKTDFDNENTSKKQSTNSAGITYDSGYYTISISLGGKSKGYIVDSAYTASIKAYKPNTPRSWFDPEKVENPNLEGEGSTTSYVYTDILKGRILWELSVINDVKQNGDNKVYSISYHTDYKLTATSNSDEEEVEVSIDLANDENVKDLYKYSRDVKELFSDGSDGYTISVNDFYKLRIYAQGTPDSKDPSFVASGKTPFLNSNTYEYGNTINILDIEDPKVTNSTLTWSTGSGSSTTEVYIYGPLNEFYEYDHEYKKTGNEIVDTSTSWKTNPGAIKKLAMLRYLNNDPNAFVEIPSLFNRESYDTDESYNAAIESLIFQLKEIATANKPTLENYIDKPVVDVDGTRATQYNLNDNKKYSSGGYAIFTIEKGDGKGVIDSPISNAVYAYKLDTVTRKIENNADKNWIGQEDTLGMFEWDGVPQANAYQIYVYARTYDENGSPIDEKIYEDFVYNSTTYEMQSDATYNKNGVEYFIKIVSQNVTEENGIYRITDNYFNSDTKATVDDAEGDSQKGAYFRIDIPDNIVVDDTGKIVWNLNEKGQQVVDKKINNYFIMFNDQLQNNMAKATDDADPEYVVPEELVGTISVQIKGIANYGSKYLNSSFSTEFNVTRITDPNPRVVNGIFTWATEGGEQMGQEISATKLTIDSKEPIVLTPSNIKYPYYTDMVKYNKNYKAQNDEALYPMGTQLFTTKFMGTSGNSSNLKPGERFMLASKDKDYYVNKLKTPTIENVIDNNVTRENQVRWEAIDNASGYRVVIFYEAQAGSTKVKYEYIIQQIDAIWYVTQVDASNDTFTEEVILADNPYFAMGVVDETSYVYFKLTNMINIITELGDTDGYSLTIYTQALGTVESTELMGTKLNPAYINSSFSDYVIAAVPATPTNAVFNPSNGVLSWSVANEKGFNIVLTAEYTVSNVTADEIGYWRDSASKLAEVEDITNANWASADDTNNAIENIIGFDSIKSRYVLIQGEFAPFTIRVRDTMLLENDEDKNTPTSYSLTAVGRDYRFELTTTAYANIEVEEGEEAGTGLTYKSTTYVFVPSNSQEFTIFDSGNGSSMLPYKVSNEVGFNAIRYFKDRHFVITEDINVSKTWSVIEDEFTVTEQINISGYNRNMTYEFDGIFKGSIDGNNHYVYNLRTSGNNASIFESIAKEATIKNLNLQVEFITGEGTYGSLRSAGLAITNKGTIDNVHIGTYIDSEDKQFDSTIKIEGASSTSSSAARVGGMVVFNEGIIKDSSVNATIKAIDTGSQTNQFTYAGGIAAIMRYEGSQIVNTHFGGYIEANYASGIVTQINETGTISGCYVERGYYDQTSSKYVGTVIKGVDTIYGDSTHYKNSTVAGLVAIVNDAKTVLIEKSYSLAQLIVKKGENNANATTANAGGLVGVAKTLSGGYAKVNNCYVVVNIVYEGNGSNIQHVAMAPSAITIDDNCNSYYYIEKTLASGTISKGTACSSLADLKSKLNTAIYNTITDYPTLV